MNYRLGLDFGGVISQGHTVDDLMPGVIDGVKLVRSFFKEMFIVSRVDNVDSLNRVLQYMNDRQLWSQLGIPSDNIRFCIRRCDKAPICRDIGITHFVDDHTEVLTYMGSVPHRYALGTKPEELTVFPAENGIQLCNTWPEIASLIYMDASDR